MIQNTQAYQSSIMDLRVIAWAGMAASGTDSQISLVMERNIQYT